VNVLELMCLLLVLMWAGLRFWRCDDRRQLLAQVVIIATAAWITEDTCIRLYGFYAYDNHAWTLFIDQVPLLVVCIWPVVVTCALDLGRALDVAPSRWPLLLFVLVVVDAWFIEPIAVFAGLWSWTEDGTFGVPVIGVLGWGCFACGVGIVAWQQQRGRRRWPFAAVLIVAPLVCHALLLGLWWGLFRWVPAATNEPLRALAACVSSLAIVALVLKERPPGLRWLVLLRVPAALFFFGLLVREANVDDDRDLIIWSLAFAPPWLALFLFSRSRPTASAAQP